MFICFMFQHEFNIILICFDGIVTYILNLNRQIISEDKIFRRITFSASCEISALMSAEIVSDKVSLNIKYIFYLKEWETIEKVAADGTVRRYRRRIVETVITTLNKKESGYQRSGYERTGANGLPVRMEEFDDSHPHNNIDPSVRMKRHFLHDVNNIDDINNNTYRLYFTPEPSLEPSHI